MGGKYKAIPVDRIRELYRPDFEAGTLTALVRVNRSIRAGMVIQATPDQRALYARVRIDGQRLALHRVLWSLRYNRDPGPSMVVDHINGDTRDNRIGNLRIASKSENSKNRKTWSSSGLRGVYLRPRAGGAVAYRVTIHRTVTENGEKTSKMYDFGTFQCPKDAKRAYLEAIDRFGDMEYLRDGQKGDGVEAIIMTEHTNAEV